tara:strand:- start:209 stop:442 length:234 start_codon:yes stop_codon:yes gene_type:complete
MKGRWTCPSARLFFGLNEKYMEQIYEQFFLLKYHGGWSLIEAYSLPVGLRLWFVERLVKQFEKEKEQVNKVSKSSKR